MTTNARDLTENQMARLEAFVDNRDTEGLKKGLSILAGRGTEVIENVINQLWITNHIASLEVKDEAFREMYGTNLCLTIDGQYARPIRGDKDHCYPLEEKEVKAAEAEIPRIKSEHHEIERVLWKFNNPQTKEYQYL
jgi:hypothetical protein